MSVCLNCNKSGKAESSFYFSDFFDQPQACRFRDSAVAE